SWGKRFQELRIGIRIPPGKFGHGFALMWLENLDAALHAAAAYVNARPADQPLDFPVRLPAKPAKQQPARLAQQTHGDLHGCQGYLDMLITVKDGLTSAVGPSRAGFSRRRR